MTWSKLGSGTNPSQQWIARVGDLVDLISVGRVTSVSYSEESSPQGWNGLGTITYDEVTPNRFFRKKGSSAKPLDPNIKKYPLVNELVYILNLPGPGLNTNSVSYQPYYINTISIWNHPHHNGFPENPNTLPPEQRKDYDTTIAGSPRRITDQSSDIFLGNTFKERPNIHPLLPFEGDVIVEGRWGNSIRLGSTVVNNQTNQGQNNWSEGPLFPGDPITIIRNGQDPNSSDEGWIPITEDINNDVSSIYLTTSQTLPLVAGTNVATTYTEGFKKTSEYNKPQIILNSSRVILNATQADGTILLNGSNTIALQADTSINLFAKTDIVLDGKVRLGGSNAKESLLKGDSTIKELGKFLNNLQEFLKVCEEATYQVYNDKTKTYEAWPLLGIQRAATEFALNLDDLKKALPGLKSERSFTV